MHVHVHTGIYVCQWFQEQRQRLPPFFFIDVMVSYEWPNTIFCEECDNSKFAV